MIPLDLPPLSIGGFSATASVGDKAVTLKLVGHADMRAGPALEGTLSRLHSEATRLGVDEAIVDFRALEFMNSSCFKSFVTWLCKLRAAQQPDRYRVRFLSDPDKHWQKRSLSALSCFATDVTVTLET